MTHEDLYTKPLLPQATRKLVDTEKPLVSLDRRHPGLQLDKLSAVGDGKMEAQKVALVKATKTLRDEPLFRSLLARRQAMLDALGAKRLPMITRGSLTLHLSRSGALENAGIALHPVYGFVYLPGSGIKGLARAWAETVWASAQPHKEAAWRQIEEACGWSPQSENHKFPQPKKGLPGWRPSEIKPQPGAAAGRLVFHDAWPLRWPRLILDVINNHHAKYYADEDAPGDWEEPTLVYFLAVGRDEQFEFAISDRKPKDDGLLDLACGWLRDALTTEGAGAKTAAGYGRFKPAEGEAPAVPSPDFTKADFASASFNLKLVTPAFLAGASQQQCDCDLRPATLRGLLRWWWRTMHAAHLDRSTLKKLETAVWGDAESGSPVRIAVDFVNGGQPQQYNKKAQQFQNLLKPPRGQKVTQGLFYASYGMADDPNKEKNRWYRPAGSCWRVTLTVRTGRFNRVSLMPKQLLEQATAALWLMTQFGGAGSRSRKGFGSFDDIEVQGVGSKDDCIKLASRFRIECSLEINKGKSADTPALEEMLMGQPTVWKDPWHALDQIGMALQLFAKKGLDSKERSVLGLPRRVGRGREAQSLRAGQIDRHASPAFWSLACRQDGLLLIRLIAFPAARLPDKRVSKEKLEHLVEFARKELAQPRPLPRVAPDKGGVTPQPDQGLVRSQEVQPRQERANSVSADPAGEEAKRVKGRIGDLGGKGDVSKMPEIVKQIAQLSAPAARYECAQRLKQWLMRGGKKSLWKEKKHATTAWRQQLNSLLE